MQPAIVERSTAPHIAGTRINVYDILAESRAGLGPEELAEFFQLERAQVDAALKYIENNRERVEARYQAIMERHARGNPPELQKKLDAIRARHAPRFAELKRQYEARNGKINARNFD